MIAKILGRAGVPQPTLSVIIGPRYPYGPVLSGDVLDARIRTPHSDPNLSHIPSELRRIQQGFMSSFQTNPAHPGTEFHFEANLYGIIFYAEPLRADVIPKEPRKLISFVDIVILTGRIVRLAKTLLQGTTTNLFIRLQLVGGFNHVIAQGEIRDTGRPWRNSHYSVETVLTAEVHLIREQLDDDLMFTDHITDLMYQLMWPFNWHDRAAINQRTHEILHANRIP
jgi:hypothetical protein